MEQVMRQLVRRMNFLEEVVERQGMRINNMIREAKVLEVDTDKATAVLDAHGVKTGPVPWLQYAGSIVDWDPLSVGQRVVLFSPTGDPSRGFILPGGYTQDTPQPYTDGEMYARVLGGTKVEVTPDKHFTKTETFEIEGDVVIKGNVVVEGNVDFEAGYVKHNGTSIDDTHLHAGVIPGAANTLPPV